MAKQTEDNRGGGHSMQVAVAPVVIFSDVLGEGLE